ncbi:ABC transporter substrate-binding protein [Actinoplanes sp. NBRC 14428]|uniref:NitT/TauT family transport system substrate-binding protein n=1 Tax=Pseudosporangium ferrugineum TaxID=439699 RepID=A0A2T0RGT8_9ACTN|nr:NitT/TauT family transport system substrate-binding protein [Pseudosporangium ferrugineum]BCJ52333.1 ABC transporter substrate-binding protein [Actinoplanes sp. NBRC 14428]
MQRRTFTRTLVAAALATTLAAAAGCSDDADDKGAPSGSQALEKVTYLTSFGNFGRDGYAYVAKEKGYFREAGFDVDIKPGNGSGENVKAIVGGQAQFTPIDLTGGLLAAGGAGGAPKITGFTAVAAVQQRTMAAIMSLEGYGINTPKDLEGKTLADTPGSVVRNLFPTYAKLANVDASKVKFENGTAQTLFGTLAQHRVDGIGQFVVGKPTIEGIAKKTAVLLPYSDYLQDLYGNVLITSSKYAKDNPEKVKKFTQALLKGLQDSITNPDEAGTIIKKYVATADPKSAAAELTLMGPFVRSEASGVPVGALDSQRVARSIAILQGSGQIPAGLTPEQVITFDLVPNA